MKEIVDVKSLLTGTGDALEEYEPPEVTSLLNLARSLEKAVQEISQPFKEFSAGFENDTYHSEKDFDEAREALYRLRRQIDKWESKLSEHILALGKDHPVVNLKRFFLVRNIYRKTQLMPKDSGPKWVPEGAADDIKTLYRAELLLERRRSSWQAWKNWIESSSQWLLELEDNISQARVYLRRGLLSAAVLLRQDKMPEILEELDSLYNQIQGLEPPQCQYALAEARKVSAFQTDPDGDSNTQSILRRLPEASRLGTPTLWSKYLQLKIQNAHQEIEDLKVTCEARKEQLQELCVQMRQHISRIRPTFRSQEALLDLLTRAQEIDRNDPKVTGYQAQFDRRQAELERRRGGR
jgi:hypothetical protein